MELTTHFHRIAPDSAPYIIAEIGLNHNGDVALAEQLIRAARQAGAHAAKFQMFHSELLIAPQATLGEGPPGSLVDFFRQFELPAADWKQLAQAARDCGIDFACSVFDFESLQLYASLEPAYVKIASGDVDNRPLLEAAAARLPVIFSTGTANAAEVEQAVTWLKSANQSRAFAILQCVSLYPAQPEEYNLAVIPSWKEEYGCPIGISDHCLGNDVSLGAVALGASIVERHFTLDRSLPGPDQSMSIEPAELRALVDAAGRIFSARGDGVKRCLERELPVRQGARRSLHASRAIARGETVHDADLLPLRPAGGLSPVLSRALLGRKAVRDLAQGERIGAADLHGEGG